MFFWMILASLTGVIMFGNLQDKIKDQQDFVGPVYQAMALSTQIQHNAAFSGYVDAQKTNPGAFNEFLSQTNDGILPLVTVKPDAAGQPALSDGKGNAASLNNIVFPYIQRHLPPGYKPQNGTRSFLFCLPKSQIVNEDTPVLCSDPNVVRYIVTIRQVPRKNDGADRMAMLKAVADISSNSKFIGLIAKTSQPLANTTQGGSGGQPLGSHFYIMSRGYDIVKSAYIPDYVVCNFPLDDDSFPVTGDSRTLGDQNNGLDKHSYIAALTLLGGGGLNAGENLDFYENPNPCFAAAHF